MLHFSKVAKKVKSKKPLDTPRHDPVRAAEHAMLAKLWEAKKKADPKGTTYEAFGEPHDLAPAYVGHMIRGLRPLNLKTGTAFAGFLGVELSEISPRLALERDSLIREDGARHKVGDRSRGVPVLWVAEPGLDGSWTGQQLRGREGGRVKHDSSDVNAYAVRILGGNLAPRIKAGDFIVMEPSLTPGPGDEVLLALNDGRSMCLEFLFERDGELTFESINSNRARAVFRREDVKAMHSIVAITKPSTHF